MKTYFITGGAGFIGSNFILYMLEKYSDIKIINYDLLTYAGNLENLKSVEDNPNHRFIQGDICDKAKLVEIFKNEKIDYLVNFAAESHVDRSILGPEIFVKTNVLGTTTLLEVAREAWQIGEDTYAGGVKFLQVSTDEVYGSLGKDGFFYETSELNPHSPYSASKASADLIVKAYSDTYKFPVNITRCSNNYGPFQFPEKLIPLMINNAMNLKDLPVYGDGLQVRDWLFVTDHCKAIDLVLKNGVLGEVYNVGGHNEKTNIEIVKLIVDSVKAVVEKEASYDLIKHVKDRKAHDRRYAISPNKISEEIGWKPDVTFEEGIKKTIDWYIQNCKWLENVLSLNYREYYEKMYKNR